MKFERKHGTIAHFACYFLLSVYSHLVFNTICLIGWLSNAKFLLLKACGVWPAFMAFLTIKCFSSPEQKRFFFGFPVKSKFVPFLLVLFFLVFSKERAFGDISGFLVGVFITIWPGFAMPLFPSVSTIRNIENKRIFQFLKGFSGFYSVDLAGNQ